MLHKVGSPIRGGRRLSIFTEADLNSDPSKKRQAAKRGNSSVSEKGSSTDFVSQINEESQRINPSIVFEPIQSSRGRPLKGRKLEDDLYYYPLVKLEKGKALKHALKNNSNQTREVMSSSKRPEIVLPRELEI